MVAPCDKYQGLVVGPDGQTVADPYGMFPTLADYSEWREVADRILTRAHEYDEGPCVVVAEVVKEDNVFPMIPAGAAVSEMIIEPPRKPLAKPTGST